MVAPSGLLGVQSVPKAGQSCGFLIPRKIWPLMQISGSLVSISLHIEKPFGIMLAKLRAQVIATLGM